MTLAATVRFHIAKKALCLSIPPFQIVNRNSKIAIRKSDLSRHCVDNIILRNDLNLTLFILNQYGNIFLVDH